MRNTAIHEPGVCHLCCGSRCMKDALGASSASEHQCTEREEHTTLAAIHATDHQLGLSIPVLRIIPITEAAIFFARRWAFPLLERFCWERDRLLDGYVDRGRLGKGIALGALRVLLDARKRVGWVEWRILLSLPQESVRIGPTRSV